MKFLVISGLLLLILLVIYWRVRPYLKIARRVLDSARAMRDIGAATGGARIPQEKSATQESLVRCDACGTWFPASRKTRSASSTAAFCSTVCAEGRRENAPRVTVNQ